RTGAPARPRGRAEAGLSIVVPLFNEASNVSALHTSIVNVARSLRTTYGLAAEGIYVDDGSRDATLPAAPGLAPESLDIQVISLSGNFGKEAALLAGPDHARFGAVLFMDGDGQHPPHWSRNSSATGSMAAMTSFTPPKRTASASLGCAGSASRRFIP